MTPDRCAEDGNRRRRRGGVFRCYTEAIHGGRSLVYPIGPTRFPKFRVRNGPYSPSIRKRSTGSAEAYPFLMRARRIAGLRCMGRSGAGLSLRRRLSPAMV